MADIKVTLSLDVAGTKSTVLVPPLSVAALDRVTVVLSPKAAAGPLVEHTVKAAPHGTALSFILITANHYERAGSGVRLLLESGDTTGIALEAPIYLAGRSILTAVPLSAHALIFVNDSSTTEIAVEILVGRAAE